MEIVIGGTQPVGPPTSKGAVSGEFIEAKMLNLRPPRRRKTGTPPGQKERRNQNSVNDPVGGRVMTLLVPNGFSIPKDIASGNYRIFLRFARQKR